MSVRLLGLTSLRRAAWVCICTTVFVGCASKVLEYAKSDEKLRTEEYDKQVHVKDVAPTMPSGPVPEVKPDEPGSKKKKKKKKISKKEAAKKIGPHEPALEDKEGFIGRRPIKDPFRVGEVTALNLSYFNVVAGEMDIMVKPMVEVNGEKSYQFEVHAFSNSFFNHIYGVDDTATTYLNYDTMTPANLQISIKESKQLAEARTFFDWKNLKASYWQKKITKEHGEEEKKLEWAIKEYSQNVISAAYYLRTFQFEVGKKLAFRVADEGKNIEFTGEVLRKEKLQTDIGELNTVVMKPHIVVDGVFTPIGDVLLWLTDDDRHFLVRLETKIKIGTIVAKLKSLEKGQETPP